MENIGEKRTDMLRNWEEKSSAIIDAFLLLFGRDGRLVGIRERNYRAAFVFNVTIAIFFILLYVLIQKQTLFEVFFSSLFFNVKTIFFDFFRK